MPKPSYRDDSGAINFLPTSEEKSQLQIRREIKQLQESLDKINNDLDLIKQMLYLILSKWSEFK